MKLLKELSLSGNRITDLTPLSSLKGLETLFLMDNPKLTRAAINKLQKSLGGCRILHNVDK